MPVFPKSYFFTLILIGIGFEVNAGSGDSLSLSDCFKRAEAYSFRLEASSQRTISAREAFEQKKTVAMPEFLVDGGGNAEFLSPYNFQQAWLLMRIDWSLGDLFMKTSLYNENRILALQAEREQVRLKLMQRIALLYMSVLQNDVQIKLFRERLNLLQGHLLMANALWEAGTQSEIDVLQTRTQITKIQEQEVSVQVQRDNLKLELAKLMGIQGPGSFRLAPVELTDLEVRRMPQWVDTLIARHPLIRTLDFQILAENEKGRNIRAEQFPRFNMQTGYVSDADPTADGNYWQIMGGLTMPVFRWGRTNYQKQQLKADVQTLLLQRENVKRELTIHINQILERLDKYRDLYLKQLQRLDYSQQAFNLADIHYRAGLITNLEYLTLQEQFTETQIALQETRLRYALNLVEFYVVTGQTDHISELYMNND